MTMKRVFLCFCLLANSAFCAEPDAPSTLFQQAQKMMEQDPSDKQIDKAISLLKRATGMWQSASSKAPEYIEALDYLAIALMVQLREDAAEQEERRLADFREWIKRAGPYTKRALELCDANPAVEPEVLAMALELEAQLEGQQGAGATLWERAAKIRAERVAAISPPDPTIGTIFRRNEEHATGPTAVSLPRPTYTRIALLAKYTGLVSLKAVVGVDGKAHNIELAHGLGFGLDEQGAKALLLAQFHPAKKDGEPIPMAVELDVTFQLN